jgi:hypothetical protein
MKRRLVENKTLKNIEEEIAFYKEAPFDNEIQDLATLVQKIEAEFYCVQLCLRSIVSPINYLLRESVATEELRLYKGILGRCIEDIKNSVYYFDKVGTAKNTLKTINIGLKNCQKSYEDSKETMVRIRSLDLSVVEYQTPEEKQADEQFLKNCEDHYCGFIANIEILNIKIDSFNKDRIPEEQLSKIALEEFKAEINNLAACSEVR